jgi:hypothetical protein
MTLRLLVLMLSLLQQPAGRNVIEGQVLRADTPTPTPVVGARVILANPDVRLTRTGPLYTEIATASTDNAGRFRMEGVVPGRYRLVATAAGFVNGQYGQRKFDGPGSPLTVSNGTATPPVQIKVVPTAVITGTVRDIDNEPLSGVNVLLSKVAYTVDGGRTLSTATSAVTDDRGFYRLYWITPGEYTLSANMPAVVSGGRGFPRNPSATPPRTGYTAIYYPGVTDMSRAQTVKVNPGETLNGLALHFLPVPTRSLSGTVTLTQGGRPLTAIVQLVSQTPGLVARETSTDAEGKYSFAGLPAGNYQVMAINPIAQFEFGAASVNLQERDVSGFNLTVKRAATLRGSVTLEGGAALPNLGRTTVMLTEPPGSPNIDMSSPAVVAADGTFQINGVGTGAMEVRVNGLPPQYYVKSARFGSADAWTVPISVPGAATDTLQIVLSAEAGNVRGTAVDAAGAAFVSASIVLIPEPRFRGRLAYYRTATTDGGGNFALRGIPPGEYLLFAWDTLEDNAYYNADFVRQQEPNGTAVVVEAGKELVSRLRVIER